jgi:DNA transposition AAA+ family ATPase
MKDVFVATPNFQRYQELYNWLQGEQFGVELGAVLGRAGRGKTTAARRMYAINTNAVFVRFEEWLSHVGILREITFAVAGLRPRATQSCFDLLRQGLSGQQRVIMIDEADRMSLKHLNALRDLHDEFQTPIIFIGEEPLEAKLRQERRLMSRLRDMLKFEPVGQMDVVVFYKEALDLAISSEAASRLARHAQGDFRLVVKDALMAEQAMKASGIKELSSGVIDGICGGGAS